MKVTDESNAYSIDSLSPKLQEFIGKGRRINRLGQPFCVKDFPECTSAESNEFLIKEESFEGEFEN